MKYIILVGLPASGKTTWATEYNNESYKAKERRILNCDKYFERKENCSFEEFIIKEKKQILKNTYSVIRDEYIMKEMILDGLFTTNKDVIKLINTLEPTSNDLIEVRQWNEDREQCVINDTGRRDTNSKADIMSIPYEDINIDLIKEETGHENIEKILMDVYEKDKEIIFVESNGINVDLNGNFCSEKWVVGGTWGNCWGDSGSLSGEEPEEFEEFDEFIERICPNITFMQYKKIRNRCVSVESSKEYGYYGSCTEYNYYVCNVYKLYEVLRELGLLNN